MLAKRIIPCLDVASGRVVKGVRFKDLTDQGDPVELARRYDLQGADELVFLDITATPSREATGIEWVSQVASVISIPLTVGGGVRTLDDIQLLLRAGADKVAINSAAVRRPELIREASIRFGAQCIVAAVDVKRTPQGFQVFVSGGRVSTGHNALGWIEQLESLGAGELLVTSMDRDGTQRGYDLPLLRAVARRCSLPLIASGGVGALDHLLEGLRDGQADAVLAAGIFHRGQYSIAQAKTFLRQHGVVVRPTAGVYDGVH